MDFNFTEEHQMLLDTADKIARDFPRSYYVECAKTQTFPQAQWDALASAGILGINTPEAMAVRGWAWWRWCCCRSVWPTAAWRSCFPSSTRASRSPASAAPVPRHRSSAGCRPSPAARSAAVLPLPSLTPAPTPSRSRPSPEEGDHFILNGNKLFISGINDAHQVLVVAKTSTGEGAPELTLFVVDTDSAGLSWDRMDTMLLNAEGQFFVYFDNVKVPRENVLGKVGRGIEVLFDALNPERMVVAAGAIGGGRHALARGVEYANERTIFKGPIGAYQGLQHPMAEARAQLEAASLLVLKSAWLHDQASRPRWSATLANVGSWVGTDAAYKAADPRSSASVVTGSARLRHAEPLHRRAAGQSRPSTREMTLNHIGIHSGLAEVVLSGALAASAGPQPRSPTGPACVRAGRHGVAKTAW
ncbi:MAG: acyl-CoA dehydrogenase [Gammaproteobacteria bacterium]|nr:acyl-CoA dehydrogenase [Gammaproteobacteria bacterium]